jgi:hypothetical protein
MIESSVNTYLMEPTNILTDPDTSWFNNHGKELFVLDCL